MNTRGYFNQWKMELLYVKMMHSKYFKMKCIEK